VHMDIMRVGWVRMLYMRGHYLMVKSIIYSNGLGQGTEFKTIFGSLDNYSYIYIITIKK
jgi:hypothetical protein